MNSEEKRDIQKAEIGAMAAGQRDDPKEYPDAPYLYKQSEQENVSMSTGALVYSATDFVLPGKNGFDLAVSRQYNSGNSNAKEPNMYYENKPAVAYYYTLKAYVCDKCRDTCTMHLFRLK